MTADARIGASRIKEAEARGTDSSRLFRVDEPERPARRIRVVHCIDGLHVGGTELNMVRTLEHLDRERLDLSLVALNADGPLRARIDAARVPVHAFPIPSLYGPRTARQLARLVAHFRRVRPDVVHCHDMYTNVFATAAARLAGVPLVIASRRWWNELPSRALTAANRIGYGIAHRVLANSEAVGALVQREGVPARKLFVLPNFLEESAFAPVSDEWRTAIRGELGVPPDAIVIGIVARLSPEKQVGLLVRAFARLQRGLDTRLVIVGDGGERPALEALVRELDLAGRVHFAGHRPNRPNIHGLFDVSVLCSAHEGFPNSVVEAMAAGRPVVATAVGGVPDAVADGTTGSLVPSGEVVGLAGALDALVADPGRRSRFGDSGRVAARTRYHEAVVIPRLANLYASALSVRGS